MDSCGVPTFPPTKCRKCAIEGRQNFFRDTWGTITERCRICGTEHYPHIIQKNGTNPRVGGRDI